MDDFIVNRTFAADTKLQDILIEYLTIKVLEKLTEQQADCCNLEADVRAAGD